MRFWGRLGGGLDGPLRAGVARRPAGGVGRPRARAMIGRRCDVLVVGGGPGGSTAAALLAQQDFSVLVVERESFPRFHVGESLLPANVLLFDRLGVHDALRKAGPLVKYGATFYDQESDHEHTFYFMQGRSVPTYGYQVLRAEFDSILLDHARSSGAEVLQPATA